MLDKNIYVKFVMEEIVCSCVKFGFLGIEGFIIVDKIKDLRV